MDPKLSREFVGKLVDILKINTHLFVQEF
jgi:hypothetical protein